jgi:hypothetical protein
MKKLLIGAGFAALATSAFAQYYPPGGYGGGGYYAPRYRTVCHYEPRQVCDYYGYCRYVNRQVCRRVAY